MHNVEVFVNYDPPCNSVSTARRLNKRSSSSSSSWSQSRSMTPSDAKKTTTKDGLKASTI